MSDIAKRLEQVPAGEPVRRGVTVADLIDRQKDEIARALPNAMSPERFARLVLTEVRKTPRLAECTPASLLGAVMTAAQLGLEPGHLQHAYLVPRRNKSRWEVQFQLGYRGIVDLALRGGRTVRLDAHVVYEHDRFDFAYGTRAFLEHRPAPGDRGAAVWVYAVAELREGGTPFVVLSVSEVERRRARGGRDGSNDSPAWVNDWAAMARKTAVRALAPWLPQTTEFSAAQRLDEQVRTDYTASLDDLEPDEPDDEPVQVTAEVVDAVDEAEIARRAEVWLSLTGTTKGRKALADWHKANDAGPDHTAWAPELWDAFEAWINTPAEEGTKD